jgi:hypothetical protein
MHRDRNLWFQRLHHPPGLLCVNCIVTANWDKQDIDFTDLLNRFFIKFMTQVTEMAERDIVTDEFIQNHSSPSFPMSGIMERRKTHDLNVANRPFPLIGDYLRSIFFNGFHTIMIIMIMRH